MGTYRLKKCDVDKAVRSAVASGYRLIGIYMYITYMFMENKIFILFIYIIDSAIGYNNEEPIGKTIKELIDNTSLGLKREDFFITSKLR